MIEGGGEDDVGDLELALDQFLEDTEGIEAGHLDVEEDQVGVVFFDEVDGVEAVFALGEELDFGEGFEEEGQFFAGGLFVVDDDGGDGHGYGASIARRSGIGHGDAKRAQKKGK